MDKKKRRWEWEKIKIHVLLFKQFLLFFCRYQEQAFLITSTWQWDREDCLLLHLFPVAFKTSWALQALTRNTKAAEQVVLHSNTPELQTGNYVLGQVWYQVSEYCLTMQWMCQSGLGDNTTPGGCRLLIWVHPGFTEKVSHFWQSFRLLPNHQTHLCTTVFESLVSHCFPKFTLGSWKNLNLCFLKNSVNGSFQMLEKAEVRFSWLFCSRTHRSVLGEEEQFLSTNLREKSVGTNTDT